MGRQFVFALFFLFCVNSFAKSVPFSSIELSTPYPVKQAALVANILPNPGKEVLTFGIKENGERHISIFGEKRSGQGLELLQEFSASTALFAFDLGEKDEEGRQSLYLLEKNAIHKYDPQSASLNKHLDVTSMYVLKNSPVFDNFEFVKDLNGDKKDDFILPQFEHLSLWMSQENKPYLMQTLPIEPQTELKFANISYTDTKLHFVDMTQDEKDDIVVAEKGKLLVYEQTAQGVFAAAAIEVVLNELIHGLHWWNIKEADGQGQDQSNLSHRMLEKLEDINNDGLPDIIVLYTLSSGVLDRKNDYEFYLGYVEDGQISYPDAADSKIVSDETLIDLKVVDIDGDNQSEVMLSAFDIGISEIIGALVSGSVDQDVLIFGADSTGAFSSKALAKKEVELSFSLRKGRTGAPLVKSGDVNGDGLVDLVLSAGDKKISVVYASESGKLFKRKSVKQKIDLPKDTGNAVAEDINGDGKIDLVMHHGRLDDKNKENKLLVLMAN